MLVLLLGCLCAHAHPNALRIVAHRTALHVTEERVQIRHAVELPAHAHTGGAGVADDAQSLAETVSGLSLAGDGESLDLSVWTSEGPTITPSGAAVTTLVLHAEHEADGFRFEDGNYPGLPGYFSASITVGPGLDVLECSLFKYRDGVATASRAERWQAGDAHRRLEVRVRPRTGWLTRAFDTLRPMPEERTAWSARAPGWREAWRSPTPIFWGLTLVAGVILGSTQKDERSPSALAMALGGVATCALTLLSPVVSTAIATVGALAALATYRRDGRRLALVSTWSLAGIGSIPLVLPAILLAVVACKGAGSARSRPPWLLAIATLALVRAVAAAYS